MRQYITFANKNPHLVNEWSPRNVKGPHEVSYGSYKKYWFNCPNGHEYKTSLVTNTETDY
jgi:hypothetical protein